MPKIFGILFILTGIFAIVGGLYTWGDGSILSQSELVRVLIPWGDVILTGPLSIIGGYGILKKNLGQKVLASISVEFISLDHYSFLLVCFGTTIIRYS